MLERHGPQIKFAPGDIVVHATTGQRGVITEVDPFFSGPDYELHDLTKNRGPKKSPWYYVLMEGSKKAVYIAECHLQLDRSGQIIKHPGLSQIFTEFSNGRYIRPNH